MRRPWHIWMIFGICLAVVVAATAWISLEALRLERSEAEMRRQALLEENVRLALWRMDSALGPPLARENARPWHAYNVFYRTTGLYNLATVSVEQGDVLVPSPLLTESYPNILLFFQFGPDGTLTSPQLPAGDERQRAEGVHVTPDQIEAAEQRLDELRALATCDALLKALGQADPGIGPLLDASTLRPETVADDSPRVPPARLVQPLTATLDAALTIAPAHLGATERDLRDIDPEFQSSRNEEEFEVRDSFNRQGQGLERGLSNTLPLAAAPTGTPLKPVWIGDELLLARVVLVNGRQFVQGCWLDWPGLRQALLDEIGDLLPGASLEPAPSANEPGRMLAALPVRLVLGENPAGTMPVSSTIRLWLVIAWAGLLLGAAAVAALLVGAIRLSERRGAFVSAVTHELRTPLTTFRIYTDLLAQDGVPDEAKRRHYVRTLSTEADRLAHLVENVLAFAGLTGRRIRRFAEETSVSALVDRVTGRLADRAARAEMELVVEADEAVRSATVAADVSVVEQILLNLVDNACKYAASADDRRIHLDAARTDGAVLLRVRDHGPGIAHDVAGRLFRPFSKSAHEAADTAAGIGLGLALSRRLARRMGATLRVVADTPDGACFELTLPTA